MKSKITGFLALLCILCLLLAGCSNDSVKPVETAAPKETAAPQESAVPHETAVPAEQGEPFAEVTDDKDFSSLRTPGSQEDAEEDP